MLPRPFFLRLNDSGDCAPGIFRGRVLGGPPDFAPADTRDFVWPALAATLVSGLRILRPPAPSGWWGRLGAFALVAVPTVVLMVPMLDTFHQLAQPRPGNPDSQLLDMAALVGLVAALVTGLLLPPLRRALAPTPGR